VIEFIYANRHPEEDPPLALFLPSFLPSLNRDPLSHTRRQAITIMVTGKLAWGYFLQRVVELFISRSSPDGLRLVVVRWVSSERVSHNFAE
jgi:hypothetical protein